MKTIVRFFSALSFCALSSFQAFSAAPLNYLNVENNVVYFATSENKTETSPGCVIAETQNLWAISLASTEGRNLYRALLSANASGSNIEVKTASDCQVTQGVERPLSIEIVLL